MFLLPGSHCLAAISTVQPKTAHNQMTAISYSSTVLSNGALFLLVKTTGRLPVDVHVH